MRGVVPLANLSVLTRVVEGVQYFYVELFEVFHIAGGYCEPQNASGCGNHGVSREGIRFTVHQTRPFPIDRAVGWKNRVIAHDAVEPSFQLFCLRYILDAGQFDSLLNLGDDNSGDGQLMGRDR